MDYTYLVEKAFEAQNSNYEKIPIGVFYKEERDTYEGVLPQIKEKALVEQEDVADISSAYEEML